MVAATFGNTVRISSRLMLALLISCLLQFEPAIHVQNLPRDVVRVTRTEKPNRVRHVLRLAIPAQENAGLDLVARQFPHRAGHLGLDDSRRHGVHRDAPRRDLDGQRAGEGVDGALACGVIRLPPPTLSPETN